MKTYTFLEILNWMSESEENVAKGGSSLFKMEYGRLYIKYANQWKLCSSAFSYLDERSWSKSEPAPEEVEVVAYLTNSGVLTFAGLGSKQDEALSKSDIWRKVKMRFT